MELAPVVRLELGVERAVCFVKLFKFTLAFRELENPTKEPALSLESLREPPGLGVGTGES